MARSFIRASIGVNGIEAAHAAYEVKAAHVSIINVCRASRREGSSRLPALLFIRSTL